ncbi:hypothetical protein SanaruYs_14910 [Chryseotalea sanaruensis]|uniref:Uncharacterized protein n=1 Tax=Chryseotalea sanaruensis TaxID=2482724 RepID=A0A401U8Q7_9BACT|nr:hypothetical protein SanaruYs_14910 [Chryseotalea sanaruensis]
MDMDLLTTNATVGFICFHDMIHCMTTLYGLTSLSSNQVAKNSQRYTTFSCSILSDPIIHEIIYSMSSQHIQLTQKASYQALLQF